MNSTSGARVSIVRASDATKNDGSTVMEEIFADAIAWDGQYDDATAWEDAVYTLLRRASNDLSQGLGTVRSLCVSGTSASCLMVDANGAVTRTARMYDYNALQSSTPEHEDIVERVLKALDRYAPKRHTARAGTGSLAKLLSWMLQEPPKDGEALCHQADYISMKLRSEPDQARASIVSDWHNTLKCGYNVRDLEWPAWVLGCLQQAAGIPMKDAAAILPSPVVAPGGPVGTVSASLAQEFGLSPDTMVVGGTTDSNAAFFAAVGGTQAAMGTAVTSLGSTLAMKQLSSTFVEDATRGVYSHRFPTTTTTATTATTTTTTTTDGDDDDGTAAQSANEAWLVGGASNVGCAVLRSQDFSNQELQELSTQMDSTKDLPLSYYPLVKKGERFPTADAEKLPVLEPKPATRVEYLQAILEGISNVERDGFSVLGELGATPSIPSTVWTCGGGSRNDAWTAIRQRKLRECFETDDIVVARAPNTEASYGAAVLAASSFLS